MNTNTKILIGCGVAAAVLVFVALAFVGLFFVRSYRTSVPRRQPPVALGNPAVLQGQGLLSKRVIYANTAIGDVTDIVVRSNASGGPRLEIAGSYGAATLDATGKSLQNVSYPMQGSRVDVVDVEGDGVCEYLSRGNWGSPSTLIGHNGAVMWTYGSGVDDTAAGDINGDGVLEFAVGFNGGGGVHLVDRRGRRIWQQPDGNVWHVEMADTNGDGRPEIVHSNAAGQITVRGGNGRVISSVTPQSYFDKFCLCRWPVKAGKWRAILGDASGIWVFDLNGPTISRLPAPNCDRFGDPRATTVRLVNGKPEYLAVILGYHNWDRSLLYLYDSTGKLVYEESLDGGAGTVAAAALGKTGAQALLVGSRGRVLEYRMATP